MYFLAFLQIFLWQAQPLLVPVLVLALVQIFSLPQLQSGQALLLWQQFCLLALPFWSRL
jgi:hypothetical protein